MSREFDLVLFGATGFTGELTATYLAGHQPAGLRWAVAGRSRSALDALRERLGGEVGVVVADVDDQASLRRLAERTRVVATTVGPYLRFGAGLVGACAQAGTDYLDLTGEAEFVDRMYLEYHATARRTGARLVHACGFDSIPYDLGAQFTVGQLPAGRPIRLRGYVPAGGSASGGTFASAVTAFSRFGPAAQAHRERRAAESSLPTESDLLTESGLPTEPSGPGRRARAVAGRAGFDQAVGCWVVPLPTVDPQIVVRSARALADYGPDFSYSHFLALRSPLAGAGLVAGAATVFALAQVPATRRLLLRARPAGSGPSAEQRARGWFRVRFVADVAAGSQAPAERLVTEVAGGDPGYGATSMMLAEAALCLCRDDLPSGGGQTTTAVAMGAALRTRLERAGMSFRTLPEPAPPLIRPRPARAA